MARGNYLENKQIRRVREEIVPLKVVCKRDVTEEETEKLMLKAGKIYDANYKVVVTEYFNDEPPKIQHRIEITSQKHTILYVEGTKLQDDFFDYHFDLSLLSCKLITKALKNVTSANVEIIHGDPKMIYVEGDWEPYN